jgi:hypothetical protein
MRPLIVSALLPLILAGCNYAPSTSITTTTINGVDLIDSSIRETAQGRAEFACNESASGHCFYAVFTSECRSDAKNLGVDTCTTQHIADFALTKGESKALSGLPPDFKHCVARTKPTPPYCASTPQG